MIKVINKDKTTGRITFEVSGINAAFANTIRRLVTEAVPTMAIHEVEFIKNDGALYDEMLAHRLGLIPLTTDLSSYEIKKQDDELSAKNSLKLFLKAKGPCVVYAEQIETQDPKVKPVNPRTPIVKLLKGQDLELQAVALLGTGHEHVKYVPGRVWYRHKKTAKVNNNHKDFNEYKAKYPQKVFNGNKIDPKLIEKYNLFDACEGVHKEIVTVENDKTTFIFNIEPWGQLSCNEIIENASKALLKLLTEFGQAFG